jgi:hypothetical protein
LISRKRFRAPGNGACILGNIPRRAAVPIAAWYVVVCEAGMLGRRVKRDVTNVNSGSERHGERLDGAIQVLVIERVLIVPDSGAGVGDFAAHEPNTIVSRIGFELL